MNVLNCDLFVLNPKADSGDFIDGLLNRLSKIQTLSVMLGGNDEDWSNDTRQEGAVAVFDTAQECETLVNALHDCYRSVSEEMHRLDSEQSGGGAQ